MDFRVGGREVLRGRWRSGTVYKLHAVYLYFVPDDGGLRAQGDKDAVGPALSVS